MTAERFSAWGPKSDVRCPKVEEVAEYGARGKVPPSPSARDFGEDGWGIFNAGDENPHLIWGASPLV